MTDTLYLRPVHDQRFSTDAWARAHDAQRMERMRRAVERIEAEVRALKEIMDAENEGRNDDDPLLSESR